MRLFTSLFPNFCAALACRVSRTRRACGGWLASAGARPGSPRCRRCRCCRACASCTCRRTGCGASRRCGARPRCACSTCRSTRWPARRARWPRSRPPRPRWPSGEPAGRRAGVRPGPSRRRRRPAAVSAMLADYGRRSAEQQQCFVSASVGIAAARARHHRSSSQVHLPFRTISMLRIRLQSAPRVLRSVFEACASAKRLTPWPPAPPACASPTACASST